MLFLTLMNKVYQELDPKNKTEDFLITQPNTSLEKRKSIRMEILCFI